MSVFSTPKKRIAAAGAAVAGLSAPLLLAATTPDVLTGYFGLEYKSADRVLTAIEAGTDVAAALSLFGGVTAAGGVAMWMLKKAITAGGRRAIIA